MGFGIIGSEFHFPNSQLSQCGFVCDTIQSQTPLYVSPVPDNHALAIDAFIYRVFDYFKYYFHVYYKFLYINRNFLEKTYLQ